MGYILKNTQGLLSTRLTDTARLKLSQGSFNISYFQVGDSEVSYNTLTGTPYNQFTTNILEPAFNAQNSTAAPETNKQNVKYPYYVDGITGNTYGIPYMASVPQAVYNRAAMRGFFTGNTTATTINWSALTNSQYTINSNYLVDMSTLTGGSVIQLVYSGCNSNIVRLPMIGDFVTIYYDGQGEYNCYCDPNPTPTPTSTPTPTPTYEANPTPTPTPTITKSANICDQGPTPTPSSTCCTTPLPPTPTPPDCEMSMSSCYPILTYKIIDICNGLYTLDRPTPDFSNFSSGCFARVLVYPPNMTTLYDSITPNSHWNQNVINFESLCSTDESDVKIWNMNIPWSENPAGLYDSFYKGYQYFGSASYLGSKEYFGYMSDSGQTDTSVVYYYNSFDEQVVVQPSEQKAIAIIHYTNQSIDFFYGEKFAFEPYDSNNPSDTTGEARNFRLHLPWLMWHKNPECCKGQTFWVDPPGFDSDTFPQIFKDQYILSTKNLGMNDPGIRYYNLWDTNVNESTGLPNRVGKVFPDSQIIIIDDEEIIAAMSYKSNRNWTLPAPKVGLTTPNTCVVENNQPTVNGILTADTEYMYVTYRFSNTDIFTNSLHCNYYTKIQGPNISCGNLTEQNVSIRFGAEFPCLNQPTLIPTTTTTTTTTTTLCPSCDLITGFYADTFQVICQKVIGTGRPNPDDWKIIDFTSQISATTINGYLTVDSLTGTTFTITEENYAAADDYNLNDYIPLVSGNTTTPSLNFGDEYYFYGSLETDIEATIYEMKYKINLGQAEFQSTSNPTWTKGTSSYITEIGLYDNEMNLMIVSKLQSPVLRQGIQQFLVKFDF
jgi:hypothetical protein